MSSDNMKCTTETTYEGDILLSAPVGSGLVMTIMVILLILAVPRRNLMLPLLGEFLVVARRVEVVALAVLFALRVSVYAFHVIDTIDS